MANINKLDIYLLKEYLISLKDVDDRDVKYIKEQILSIITDFLKESTPSTQNSLPSSE